MAAVVKGKEDRRRREARDSKRVQRVQRRNEGEEERNQIAVARVVLYQHLRDVVPIVIDRQLAQMIEDEEWAELVEEDAIEQEWDRLEAELAAIEGSKQTFLAAVRAELLPADTRAFRDSAAGLVERSAHFLDEVLELVERRRKFRERE